MNVLSIQSRVVYGHVGNDAAVFALQRLGHEAWALPTVLYSNHPAHGSFRGRASTPDELAALVEGIEERGVLKRCAAVLSGYLGDAALVPVVTDAVSRVRALNPDAFYCCDPVMGHEGRGFFVADAVRRAVTDRLVPAADIITPNQFELGALTGLAIGSLDEAIAACEVARARGPETVVCTSFRPGGDEIGAVMVSGVGAWLVLTPRLDGDLFGAGDLFAALLVAALIEGQPPPEALGRAVSAAYGILEATAAAGERELLLISAQDRLAVPTHRFVAKRLR
jgi:pyridoxine kinase